jgi:hypothetical protein
VQPNRPAINQQLSKILNDLNQFLTDGVIRPATIVDAMTGEGITDMLLANIGLYAENLKQFADTTYQFEDDVNQWWMGSRLEFPDEPDRWKVLARNNLITMFNKFIFAHALKHYNSSANLVDTIDPNTSLIDGIQVFERISISADFWNIFSRNLGDELTPAYTWSNFKDLNALLKEFSVSQIDASLIHDLLENLAVKVKRKVAGQFATPMPLARLLATLVVLDAAQNVLDPCCGSGTIAKAVYDLKVQKGVKEPLSSLWASDKFALPLNLATLSIAQPENMGKLMRIFPADATQLKPAMAITLHDPRNGAAITASLPTFPFIISNLPFVRQEDLASLNPGIDSINEKIRMLTGDSQLGLAARSDLYTYLPFYLWQMLESGGRLGIIISNSWLATEMGDKFFAALTKFYEVEAIITSGKGRWFQNAKVVTNILLLKKHDQPSVPIPQNVKFVVLKQTVETIAADDLLLDVRSLLHAGQSKEGLLDIQTYTEAELDYLRSLSLPASAYFANLAWLSEVEPSTIKLSQLFNVNRGERRGWDPLFFPPKTNNIEPDYLKPVLKSPQSARGLQVEPDGLAFCCPLSQAELKSLGHRGALAWIESFESAVNEVGQPLTKSLARPGIHWYTMKPDTLADFVTATNPGERLFIGKFAQPTFVNQRLIRLTRLQSDLDVELTQALLNSLLGLFYIEALGFGRGEGVLDLNPTKLKSSMRLLNPALIGAPDRAKILEKFQPLLDRPVLKLEDELTSPDRQLFDETVLQAYNLVELHDDIKAALLKLHRIRNAVNTKSA